MLLNHRTIWQIGLLTHVKYETTSATTTTRSCGKAKGSKFQIKWKAFTLLMNERPKKISIIFHWKPIYSILSLYFNLWSIYSSIKTSQERTNMDIWFNSNNQNCNFVVFNGGLMIIYFSYTLIHAKMTCQLLEMIETKSSSFNDKTIFKQWDLFLGKITVNNTTIC